MASELKAIITYQDFIRMIGPEETQSNEKKEEEKSEAVGGVEIEKVKKDPEVNLTQFEQTAILTNLCRVCGSPGNISIYTEPPEVFVSFKPTPESRKNKVTIAKMISDIADEHIEKTDFLPQFVCSHCLGYLQHAFNIRNQIKDTARNFRFVQQIQENEAITLQLSPSSQMPSVSQNQREIFDDKVDMEQVKYWNDAIEVRTNKIKLKAPQKEKRAERLMEHKCNSCLKRVYSIKSLNIHMENCVITRLATFFSELSNLYSARLAFKISSIEYQISALSLIYNTNKTLRQIAKKQKYKLDALSQEEGHHHSTNQLQKSRKTPDDIGYNSGYAS